MQQTSGMGERESEERTAKLVSLGIVAVLGVVVTVCAVPRRARCHSRYRSCLCTNLLEPVPLRQLVRVPA